MLTRWARWAPWLKTGSAPHKFLAAGLLEEGNETVAAPWLKAAFKAIPWKEVVAAAPSIVESTRRLWDNVTRTEKRPSPAGERSGNSSAGSSNQISALEDRLMALEAKTSEMAHEAVTSAELIKSLAEQNARLVQAVELLRLRTRRWVWITAALGLAMAFLIFWVGIHT